MRLLSETRNGRHSLYLYDEGSYDPLARVDGQDEHARLRYYHTDPNGLPQQLTEDDGRCIWQARYQVWGNTLAEQQESFFVEEQNLRFQGQYLDRETGLHYNTFRFYDPDIGRFISPDPIGLLGGANLYQYAPNPLAWSDPLGWAPWARGKFDDWFNTASINDINSNKAAVSEALRGAGKMHEMFPVSLAAKAKELGFTAQELKKYVVETKRITFVNVTDSKGRPVPDGSHHGSRAGRNFHNKLIADLEGSTSKREAKMIIAKHHRAHMKLSRCT